VASANGEESVRNRFVGDLLPGERIVWVGQPDPTVFFSWVDRFLVPFSLVWTGGAFVTLVRAITRGYSAPSLILSVIFSVLGTYLLFGRLFYRRRMRRKTFYAVTNRRVLVLSEVPRRLLLAAFLDRIPVVQRWIRSDGIGTLQFGAASRMDTIFGTTGLEPLGRVSPPAVPVFWDVRDAEEVFRLVSGVRRSD
jgi:hypothetical protein